MITFVSYSSKNQNLAQALALALGVFGHDVQFERKIVGGQVVWHEVFESIRACDLFVLAVSIRSLDSYSCQVEYSYANALGKRILPIVIEDIDTAVLHQHFGDHYIHWRPGEEGGAALQHALSHLPPPAPRPTVPPLRPDLIVPLMRLRDSALSVPPSAPAQFSLLDNLKEFLEREDTFIDALSILRVLETKFELSDIAAEELEDIFKQVAQAKKQKSPGRPTRWLRDVALVVAGAVLILIVVRGLQFLTPSSEPAPSATPASSGELVSTAAPASATVAPSSEPASSATPESSAVSLLPTEAVATESVATEAVATDRVATDVVATAQEVPSATPDLTQTEAAFEVAGTVTAAISTARAVALVTLSPLPSETRLPQATATPPPDAAVNAPALTETQGMLNLQGTATSTIGTAVALANNATVPPTLTLAPLPTSRALGYVGIEVEDSEAGVRVTGVRSAAQQAGIREGDFIEAVDVQRVATREEFLANMDAREPFSLVTFRLRRGNTTIYIRATLGLLDFAAPASG